MPKHEPETFQPAVFLWNRCLSGATQELKDFSKGYTIAVVGRQMEREMHRAGTNGQPQYRKRHCARSNSKSRQPFKSAAANRTADPALLTFPGEHGKTAAEKCRQGFSEIQDTPAVGRQIAQYTNTLKLSAALQSRGWQKHRS
ncbi:hypothetical protein WBQ28_27410 [Pseudomonas syringae pv. syringae]|uniref:hypothetical protein n=1 Tax=Pseudomonas syringae TaxID=317 RepID=UPI003B000FDE